MFKAQSYTDHVSEEPQASWQQSQGSRDNNFKSSLSVKTYRGSFGTLGCPPHKSSWRPVHVPHSHHPQTHTAFSVLCWLLPAPCPQRACFQKSAFCGGPISQQSVEQVRTTLPGDSACLPNQLSPHGVCCFASDKCPLTDSRQAHKSLILTNSLVCFAFVDQLICKVPTQCGHYVVGILPREMGLLSFWMVVASFTVYNRCDPSTHWLNKHSLSQKGAR